MHSNIHCSDINDSRSIAAIEMSTNKRKKKMWCVHTMEHYSAIGKNDITPFVATSMDLEMIILSAVNQTEKDRYPMILLLCRLLRKKIQTNLFTKQK